MPFVDMVANNYTMKVILPEGAINIKVLNSLYRIDLNRSRIRQSR